MKTYNDKETTLPASSLFSNHPEHLHPRPVPQELQQQGLLFRSSKKRSGDESFSNLDNEKNASDIATLKEYLLPVAVVKRRKLLRSAGVISADDNEAFEKDAIPAGSSGSNYPSAASNEAAAISSASASETSTLELEEMQELEDYDDMQDIMMDDETDEEVITLADCMDGTSTKSHNQPETAIISIQSPLMQTTNARSATTSNTTTMLELLGDFKTAIVIEEALKHFDRSNRFAKDRPPRIASIVKALQGDCQENLMDRCCLIHGENDYLHENTLRGTDGTAPLPSSSSFLTEKDYLQVHRPGYMQRLDKFSSSCSSCHTTDQSVLDAEAQQFSDIFLTNDSVAAAKQAAASLCRLVERVVTGQLDNGFAIVRPPGHHAEPAQAGGYCLINNVAVAAAYARSKLGVNKVLVVDWDVHHGNGTQSIFLDDPNVLYFSVHRWHGGNFYPFRPSGGPRSVGTGRGQGYSINVGWTHKGMGDEEYAAVWEQLLLPVAREFDPDLVLVSAGFDAAQGDMGECCLTPQGFAYLTRALMTLAQGRVVCALEGGYVHSILGQCVKSVVKTLLNRESPRICLQEELEHAVDEEDDNDTMMSIDASAARDIRATMNAHRPYWKCLATDEALAL